MLNGFKKRATTAIKENSLLTSAAHAVPLLYGFRHLLSDADAVSVEPLVAVVTTTGKEKKRPTS